MKTIYRLLIIFLTIGLVAGIIYMVVPRTSNLSSSAFSGLRSESGHFDSDFGKPGNSVQGVGRGAMERGGFAERGGHFEHFSLAEGLSSVFKNLLIIALVTSVVVVIQKLTSAAFKHRAPTPPVMPLAE